MTSVFIFVLCVLAAYGAATLIIKTTRAINIHKISSPLSEDIESAIVLGFAVERTFDHVKDNAPFQDGDFCFVDIWDAKNHCGGRVLCLPKELEGFRIGDRVSFVNGQLIKKEEKLQ